MVKEVVENTFPACPEGELGPMRRKLGGLDPMSPS